MTSTPISISTIGTNSINFQPEHGFLGLGFAQKEVMSGVYTLFTGNGNKSDLNGYDNNLEDKLLWSIQNGNFSNYLCSDIDKNDDINGQDRF